jgi:hypothetical protein
MRVSRMVYGVELNRWDSDTDPECLARKDTAYYDNAGRLVIPKGFEPILLKVESVALSEWHCITKMDAESGG